MEGLRVNCGVRYFKPPLCLLSDVEEYGSCNSQVCDRPDSRPFVVLRLQIGLFLCVKFSRSLSTKRSSPTGGTKLDVTVGGYSYLTHRGVEQDNTPSFPSSVSSKTSPYTTTLQVLVLVDHFPQLGYFVGRIRGYFGRFLPPPFSSSAFCLWKVSSSVPLGPDPSQSVSHHSHPRNYSTLGIPLVACCVTSEFRVLPSRL